MYLLACVDVFTRKAYVEPMAQKDASHVKTAFEAIAYSLVLLCVPAQIQDVKLPKLIGICCDYMSFGLFLLLWLRELGGVVLLEELLDMAFGYFRVFGLHFLMKV